MTKNKFSETLEAIYTYTGKEFLNKKLEELRTAEERAAWLMLKYPRTRDSDKELIYIYWKTFDNVKEVGDIFSATSAETIRRVRAKLQNKYGLFPSSEKVKKDRQDLDHVFKGWAVE